MNEWISQLDSTCLRVLAFPTIDVREFFFYKLYMYYQ